MNEQIRVLADQATDVIEIVNPDTGITHTREFFDKEKFAELIVQECANLMLEWKSEPFPLDPEFAAKIIKEHFGVK